MASIVISGDVPTKVNEMVNNLLKGKIGISQFIKFLHDNDLETKVNYINKDVEPSVLDDFIGDTLCNIFCYKNSEHEDTENYTEDEENDEEEIEDNEYEKPELIKKSNEVYEKDVKDTVDFAKRLIDDYGDSEEDDIDHAKAVKLFYSLMLLARTYRQKASKGDEKFNIPNFVPENILKFIESLDLPTDKIKAASERGKSNHYKMKNYKSFEEFEKNMKYAYGIENVWKPTKEVPEWFESVRNMLYRKFYPTEDILIDESEWNEFKKWKEENNKKSSTSKKTTVSASVKTDKTQAKKTTTKPSKTDAEKLKEFKRYLDYILLNSPVEDDARDLLLSYAANMDERCKDLYKQLIDLKKRHKLVKLVKYFNEKTDNEDISFAEL